MVIDCGPAAQRTRRVITAGKGVPIPAATLSKFINGGGMPEKYRELLTNAVMVF